MPLEKEPHTVIEDLESAKGRAHELPDRRDRLHGPPPGSNDLPHARIRHRRRRPLTSPLPEGGWARLADQIVAHTAATNLHDSERWQRTTDLTPELMPRSFFLRSAEPSRQTTRGR